MIYADGTTSKIISGAGQVCIVEGASVAFCGAAVSFDGLAHDINTTEAITSDTTTFNNFFCISFSFQIFSGLGLRLPLRKITEQIVYF